MASKIAENVSVQRPVELVRQRAVLEHIAGAYLKTGFVMETTTAEITAMSKIVVGVHLSQ